MCSIIISAVRARRCMVRWATLGCALSVAVHATSTAASESLGLNQTIALALEQQPLLESLDASARAAREASIWAAQLPDPRVVAGIRDLPINTDDAYSFTRDSDTQIVVGIAQEFPRAQKRRLRGVLLLKEAERLQAEHRLAACVVRRDASLAWLALWRDEMARQISVDMRKMARLQAQAVAIVARSGLAPQSDLLLAQLDVERMDDVIAEREQVLDRSRYALHRWISDAARLPVSQAEPELPVTPTALGLLEGLAQHPELVVLRQRIDESKVGVDLARANRLPDWRVEVGYGHRREFSDMVMLQFGLDLPLFAHNRQDRLVASALAMGEAAAAQWESGRRQLESRVLQATRDLQHLRKRLTAYDDTILPQTLLGIESAGAAWRSGRGTLEQVLQARRTRLDVLMARLKLQHDLFGRQIELIYLSGG